MIPDKINYYDEKLVGALILCDELPALYSYSLQCSHRLVRIEEDQVF